MQYPTRNALILVILSTLLQVAALLGVWTPDGHAGWLLFGALEMLLIVLLLANGGAILSQLADRPEARIIAGWCFLGLLLCSLGDLVNRNFGNVYFQHGVHIEHSYLVNSIWFFLPGYAVLIYAGHRVVADKIPLLHRLSLAVSFAGGGLLAFVAMRHPESGFYVSTLAGSYAVVIAVTGATGFALLIAGGAVMFPVAIGYLLALLADALIAQFWLFGEGHYPAIRHINWIIYFASQALIQQLPLRMPRTSQPAA